mmetsp:Transcript_14270/g.35430  ORF Transcript_14270/g.35430 Transcript_14270/m.35430 type:complete len:204 (+) Transcript_14270:2626-3237(+)
MYTQLLTRFPSVIAAAEVAAVVTRPTTALSAIVASRSGNAEHAAVLEGPPRVDGRELAAGEVLHTRATLSLGYSTPSSVCASRRDSSTRLATSVPDPHEPIFRSKGTVRSLSACSAGAVPRHIRSNSGAICIKLPGRSAIVCKSVAARRRAEEMSARPSMTMFLSFLRSSGQMCGGRITFVILSGGRESATVAPSSAAAGAFS